MLLCRRVAGGLVVPVFPDLEESTGLRGAGKLSLGVCSENIRERNVFRQQDCMENSALVAAGDLQKSRLKAHGFNRGMKGGVARHPLLGMVRATNLLYNRTYERCSSHW
jgi:hypothetical protein